MRRSTAGPLEFPYGMFGDIPVPADYDGDGDADIGVFRPWTGGWWIVGLPPVNWGTGTLGDVPLPGDYDADGIEDIAVFRRDSGIWYLSQSGAGQKTLAWGVGLTDYPTPGNFVAGVPGLELAIYRPTGGHWYVHTGSGYFIVNLGGQAGDIPALRRK